MGGKLYHLPRMPRAQYLVVEAAAREVLERTLPGRYRIPRYYGDKKDFGDLDVLVAAGASWPHERAALCAALGVSEGRAVGAVYSTVFMGLQTDFFAVPPECLDAYDAYLSFNDVGNLLGRTCRRFGLKFGERGLCYVYRRADGNYVAELLLTRDFARVCALLGLSYEAWRAGFATLEALFDWVVAGEYFSVEPYLEGLAGSRAVQRRARERPTIASFLAYLRARGETKRYEFAPPERYLPMLCEAFPEADLPAQLARERDAEARAGLRRARFDGALVRALAPQLEGRALGATIQRFRARYEDFDGWLERSSRAEVEAALAAFLAEESAGGGLAD